MKFCIIASHYVKHDIGGAEVQNSYIASELLRRGHEVHHISTRPTRSPSAVEDGLHVHFLYVPVILNRLFNRLVPLRVIYEYIMLRRLMRQIAADYWYCRSVNTFLASVARIKRSVGGKLLFALSMDVQTDPRFWTQKYGQIYHRLFRNSLRHVDHFVFQSEYQQAEFSRHYGFTGRFIQNGIRGLLVDRDVTAMRDALVHLYDDRDLLFSFSQRIRADLVNLYGVKPMV
jgi:glycosyltransferase involved in cell wall biosynthesis